MATTRRIALFGGTFDPVHLGHLRIAELAKNGLHLDQVRFLPCRISPHKTDRPPTSADHRLEMLRLALAETPWAVADDYELRIPPPSYSYLTAEAMRQRHPEARLFWLMGLDQWEALPGWREPERLAAVVEFIVFDRDGRPNPRPGMTLHHLQGNHPASASEIRESCRDGQLRTDWLPSPLATYIEQQGLYSD
ncbi:MAG: nicotinate (nicotinamide) nucleotide adenylyltransferase [Verrucomicrobiota bacterium]